MDAQPINHRAELRAFTAAFGNGAAWFAEGLTMGQAKDRHIEALRAEGDKLRERIRQAGLDRDESQPPAPRGGQSRYTTQHGVNPRPGGSFREA